MNPLLSIITINRNNKLGLIKTIESVVNQICSDYEYIIVDGASTDGSREMIEQYAVHPEHGKKITWWISEPDTGIYNAMNKGIRKSTGEYCLLLNSGDWLVEESTLEKVLKEIDGSADVYYGDAYYYNPSMEDGGDRSKWQLPAQMGLYHLYTSSVCHQAAFIKRDILVSKPYNENHKIVSDWEFFLHLFLEKYVFSKLGTVVVNYDMDGISANLEQEREKERNEVLSSAIPECDRVELDTYIMLKNNSWVSYMYFFQNHKIVNKLILFSLKIIKKILSSPAAGKN